MSDSSSSGKFARDASKSAATGTSSPEEWAATRAEPASQEEIDEWQATRIQARQPNGLDEWRVPAAPVGGTPQESQRRAGRFGAAAESPDAWAATRAQTALATQLLDDENDYLATDKEEVGRQIGGNERELFVSCAPAEALQQQFEHLQPNFIAVHDIATSSSRKLLTGIAAASGRAVQKLVIRRQGYGTALAKLARTCHARPGIASVTPMSGVRAVTWRTPSLKAFSTASMTSSVPISSVPYWPS